MKIKLQEELNEDQIAKVYDNRIKVSKPEILRFAFRQQNRAIFFFRLVWYRRLLFKRRLTLYSKKGHSQVIAKWKKSYWIWNQTIVVTTVIFVDNIYRFEYSFEVSSSLLLFEPYSVWSVPWNRRIPMPRFSSLVLRLSISSF